MQSFFVFVLVKYPCGKFRKKFLNSKPHPAFDGINFLSSTPPFDDFFYDFAP